MATRPEIIAKVKERLDEISPFAEDEVDAVSLIDKLLDESANTLRLAAPIELLSALDIDVTNHVEFSPDNGTGLIPLAYDFLRLHSFKMALWATAVSEAISPSNPKYKLQQHTVTRGGTIKPVCVIRYHYRPPSQPPKIGGKVIEYFSVPVGATHTIDYAKYVKSMAAQETEDILVDTLAWQCAGDVYVVQEMPEQAQVAYAKVKEFIDKQTL